MLLLKFESKKIKLPNNFFLSESFWITITISFFSNK
ncbi:MAG: hypothetical protein RIS47_2304 [Bacteroidota bacterium]|jgi:hypothetical protein